MNKENTKFSDLEDDWNLRHDIKDSLNLLNSEITAEDSHKYKILQFLNEMFSLFDFVYSKNVGLINICRVMNDEVVQTASQIAKNLSDSDETQKELKELNENYQNVLSIATYRRDSMIDSKSEVQDYKDQITELRRNLTSAKATPRSNRKLINDLNSEIKTLKIECQRNLKESNELNIELKEQLENLANTKNVIKSYNEETENSATLLEDLDNEKDELHQMNEETKKEIKEIESENILIEEKQLEEQEKLNLQREKINISDFNKIMNEFQKQILILQEEKDDKLQSISKMSKQLKRLKSENENKNENKLKILVEIQKRDEQLDSVQQTIKSLNREYKGFFPQFDDIVKKFRTLENDKKELRAKYKKLQEDRFNLNVDYSKNENARQIQNRKIDQVITDNRNQTKYFQRETKKTDEILRQALDVNNDMTNIKRGLFEDGRYAKSINDEIEEHQKQKKFYLTNYFVQKAIIDTNKKRDEELKEKINESRRRGEQEVQNMQSAKQEKENYLKKMKEVEKEHDHLSSQLSEVSEQVQNLTRKIDSLINDTVQCHFLMSEYKTAMSYINKMKKRSENGIKITKKVIFNLISEQKTLKKIIDQTKLDELSQKKHLQILKTSHDRIVSQISQKVQLINSKSGEAMSLEQELNKCHKDYEVIQNKINIMNLENEQHLKRNILLTNKFNELKELRKKKQILEDNLIATKSQTNSFYLESQIKIHVHRWYNLMGIESDHLSYIKFHQRLKIELNKKTDELKKLEEEKKELSQKVEERKKYVDRFFQQKAPFLNDQSFLDDSNVFITNVNEAKCDFLIYEIDRLRQKLKDKNIEIEEMKDQIISQSHLIVEFREKLNELHKILNDRRSTTYQLKIEINELKKKNFNIENDIDVDAGDVPKESNEIWYQKIEEVKKKTFVKVFGGGFKPTPPSNNQTNNNSNNATVRSSVRKIRKFKRNEDSPSPSNYNYNVFEDDSNEKKKNNQQHQQHRPFRRKIHKNQQGDGGAGVEDEKDFVIKKRNGRMIKMKKSNEKNDDVDDLRNSNVIKFTNINFENELNDGDDDDDANGGEQKFAPHPPLKSPKMLHLKTNDSRRKLNRNVAVPVTSSMSKVQDKGKKKKKGIKKKK